MMVQDSGFRVSGVRFGVEVFMFWVHGMGFGVRGFISQKVFIKSFCKSQFPHKYVNLFFISVTTTDKLTGLCGNRLLQELSLAKRLYQHFL